jgi:hypothetical protein
MVTGLIADNGFPCPTICGISNSLNSWLN